MREIVVVHVACEKCGAMEVRKYDITAKTEEEKVGLRKMFSEGLTTPCGHSCGCGYYTFNKAELAGATDG